MVGNHDFTKLSIITDAHLLHEGPKPDDSEGGTKVREWYTGQMYYRFNSMLTEGSFAMRFTEELSEVMTQHFQKLTAHLYAYTDVRTERKVVNLSAQKSYISLFLKHGLDEILVARTVANLSCGNPVKKCHSKAKIGLHTIGTMRKKIYLKIEKVIRNVNSSEEIRKLCSSNKPLEKELGNSLSQPNTTIGH